MHKAKSQDSAFLKPHCLPILALLILLALWKVPQCQLSSKKLSPDKQAEMENAYRATLVQALGGLFFFVTAYFTYRNVRAIEANVRAAEEKQVTERFSKAVELLGSEKLEVRLGAIYALERIANDSKKDYWTIMEVLTAYVREKTPWQEVEKERERLPTDIQAVLTIIGRRAQANGKGEERRLDLSGTDLRMANLIGDGFKGVDFTGANFRMAYLRKAQLQKATLTVAQLQGADLTEANLEGADLTEANLERVYLKLAQLKGADFTGADLRQAFDLTEEQISQAITDESTEIPEYLKTPEQLKQEKQ